MFTHETPNLEHMYTCFSPILTHVHIYKTWASIFMCFLPHYMLICCLVFGYLIWEWFGENYYNFRIGMLALLWHHDLDMNTLVFHLLHWVFGYTTPKLQFPTCFASFHTWKQFNKVPSNFRIGNYSLMEHP